MYDCAAGFLWRLRVAQHIAGSVVVRDHRHRAARSEPAIKFKRSFRSLKHYYWSFEDDRLLAGGRG